MTERAGMVIVKRVALAMEHPRG
ncbi:hypothetical protein HALO59_40600 [Halomonas sp. 59]|nr:hypothetical protein HALO59_40600 [Halomonas sp. 59]CAD5288221.1 hypothetical protein HALOI3_50179 [Halomonas sp. I3]VXB12955.1 hypothetical protein HALO153_110179 [Halomonas titanicae]